MNKDVTQQTSPSDSEKLSLILTTVQSLTVRFDNVDARFNHIDSRLLHVEQNVHELRDGQLRLQETVLQLQEGQGQLQQGQDRISTELSALSRHVREQFLVLSGATKAQIKELDRRVPRLELNQKPSKRQT